MKKAMRWWFMTRIRLLNKFDLGETLKNIYKPEIKEILQKYNSLKDKGQQEKIATTTYYIVSREILKKVAKDVFKDSSRKKPQWAKRVEFEYRKKYKFADLPWILYNLHGIPIDNYYFTKNGDFVFEVNSLTIKDFEKLVNFCHENNLSFVVLGFSKTSPGFTFRVVIKGEDKGEEVIVHG